MQAVWLAVPESFLEERRQLGLDRRDELWDGVLHMPPPPSFAHGTVGLKLIVQLVHIGERRGLIAGSEVGVFEHDKNYRVPDAVLVRPDQGTQRGAEGAELVLEVLSLHDEARKKFPFYASRGVREIWLFEPNTRHHEIHALGGNSYTRVELVDGVTTSPLLGVELDLIDGPKLRVRDGHTVTDI
jgi:Uma2 family endonuclease